MIKESPVMTPNEIEVYCAQMRAWGQFYVGRLCSPPLSLTEWRTMALKRYAASQEAVPA